MNGMWIQNIIAVIAILLIPMTGLTIILTARLLLKPLVETLSRTLRESGLAASPDLLSEIHRLSEKIDSIDQHSSVWRRHRSSTENSWKARRKWMGPRTDIDRPVLKGNISGRWERQQPWNSGLQVFCRNRPFREPRASNIPLPSFPTTPARHRALPIPRSRPLRSLHSD